MWGEDSKTRPLSFAGAAAPCRVCGHTLPARAITDDVCKWCVQDVTRAVSRVMRGYAFARPPIAPGDAWVRSNSPEGALAARTIEAIMTRAIKEGV